MLGVSCKEEMRSRTQKSRVKMLTAQEKSGLRTRMVRSRRDASTVQRGALPAEQLPAGARLQGGDTRGHVLVSPGPLMLSRALLGTSWQSGPCPSKGRPLNPLFILKSRSSRPPVSSILPEFLSSRGNLLPLSRGNLQAPLLHPLSTPLRTPDLELPPSPLLFPQSYFPVDSPESSARFEGTDTLFSVIMIYMCLILLIILQTSGGHRLSTLFM